MRLFGGPSRVSNCPRCGFAKPVAEKLCIVCRSEDQLTGRERALRGKDHESEFETCYKPSHRLAIRGTSKGGND